ncbi:MAG TPA: hypothetical protein VFQ45_11675 [Longimicrobium sp.]|nr:hypothetical protein [Longimicrobium sp.]
MDYAEQPRRLTLLAGLAAGVAFGAGLVLALGGGRRRRPRVRAVQRASRLRTVPGGQAARRMARRRFTL